MTICLSPNGLSSSAGEGSVLFVGTIRGVCRLERSGADDWQLTARSLDGHHVGALSYDARRDRLVAATYDSGVWVSDDGARSWAQRNNGLRSTMAFSHTVQDRPDATIHWLGTEPAQLYRSDDGGETWSEQAALLRVPDTDAWSFPTPPHFAHLKNVSFHPAQPDTLYACVEQGDLLTSADGGDTWSAITSYVAPDDPFRRDIHRVVVAWSDPGRLYMTTGSGFYRSEDAGRSWERTLAPDDRVGYPDPLFVDPADDAVLYLTGASTPPRFWTDGTTGTADPAVLRSLDHGRHWEEIRHGLPDPIPGNVEAMSLHRTDDATHLYLGTTQGQVFASRDGGGTWRQIADGLPPVSKSLHYRHFLAAEERAAVDRAARARLAQSTSA